MINTLQQRISIQFLYINDDVQKSRLNLDSDSVRHLLLSLSILISLLIMTGQVIEAHRAVVLDVRWLTIYFVYRIFVNLVVR